jgi:K+-sensing histidine kinase KdpD
MSNSNSFSNRRLYDLECKLLNHEQELEKAIANKGKYLKYINFEDQVNPSIGITGLAQGLANNWDNFEPAQLKEYVLAVAKSSDRIANLLNNLLDLANICCHNFNLNLEPLNLYKVFKEKSQMNNNIKFTVNFDDDLILYSDKYLISKLLDNLISSLNNFTKIHYIQACIQKALDYVEIIISYQSAGVDSTKFDRFWHKRALRQNNFAENLEFNEDTSLALACKIVELHKGEISLKQNAKHLIFTLPI